MIRLSVLYENFDSYKMHFEKIKYNLNNFIQNLNFINNTAPIESNEFNEIGLVINLACTSILIKKNHKYFPPIPLIKTDIKQDFLSKPLIGLKDIDAALYMNATLQCLCNIKQFVKYFKYNPHLIEIVKNDINKEKLCSGFKLLIENLYPYELSKNYEIYKKNNPNKQIISQIDIFKKYYSPRNIKSIISKINPLFAGKDVKDIKDLVKFLLITLHEELNKAQQNQIDKASENIYMDETNKTFMFNNYVENFKRNYQSIISDLFIALECNLVQCSNCKIITYNYEIYFFLIFPLEKIIKYKSLNNIGFNSNVVDIYDCFEYYKKINFATGENAMYCDYCKHTCNSSMNTNLTTGAEILILILNHGEKNEFNVKLNFDQELNLYNYYI